MMHRSHLAFFIAATLATVALADSPAQPAIPADVQSLLGDVASAYGRIEQLSVTGTLTANIDAAGQRQLETREFSSSYVKPNFFRHELNGEILLGCTGKQLYVYQSKLDRYASTDAPGGAGIMSLLPSQMSDILRMQNPSLALALSSTALADLTTSVTAANIGESQIIDGTPYTTVSLSASGGNITLCVNPSTKLLRRVAIDLAAPMTKAGVPNVAKALMTIDYTSTDTNTATPYNAFAFAPPPSARNEGNMAKSDQFKAITDDANDPASLVGKSSPEFSAEDLDGKTIKVADLKGSVVLLDFWATWCGPCVIALPTIDEFHKSHEAAGLKVFAVNIQEEKPKVSKFKSDKKLSLPMLLDTDGAVARAFLVQAIPQTVLIGKDGTIRKVLVGFDPAEKQDLEDAIKKALTE